MMVWYVPLLVMIFALSIFITQRYIRFAQQKGLIDQPNHRSSHTLPTPRGGGIVFVSLWLFALAALAIGQKISLGLAFYYALPTGILALVGFIDDTYSLSGKHRFLIQAGCAVLALSLLGSLPVLDFSFFTIPYPYFNEIFAFFLILWSINLFNFMDGMDGFATSEALFIFIPGSLFLLEIGAMEEAAILAMLVMGLLGFFYWNRPRAKVFMGDIGSTSLGLVIPLTALYAQIHYNTPVILWIMLYGVFLFDATVTLLRRILHGEKWYEAHRKHAYQRLHQAGWSHGQVLMGLMCLQTWILAITGFTYYFQENAAILAFSEVGLLAIVYLWIEKTKPMN